MKFVKLLEPFSIGGMELRNRMIMPAMHLGGASDYIQIEMPVESSSANTFNYVDDAGANATDVDDYVNCSGTTTTVCKVPVSLGF